MFTPALHSSTFFFRVRSTNLRELVDAMHAVRWLTRLKRNAKHAAADAHASASRIDVSVLSTETHPFYDSAYYRLVRWLFVRPAFVALLTLAILCFPVAHTALSWALSPKKDVAFWCLVILRDGPMTSAFLVAVARRSSTLSALNRLRHLHVSKSIARRARRSLAAWYTMLLVAIVLILVAIAYNAVTAEGRTSRVVAVALATPVFLFALPIWLFWFMSLFAAFRGCDAQLKRFKLVVKTVAEDSPLDAATWDRKVVKEAYELAYDILPALNDGWSLTLTFMFLQAITYCFATFVLISFTLDDIEFATIANSTEALLGDNLNEIDEAGDFVLAAASAFTFCVFQLALALLLLFVPLQVTRRATSVTSQLKKHAFSLLSAPAEGETPEERRHRHARAKAVRALEDALRTTSKFGFNVLGVRVTPRIFFGVGGAILTLFGLVLSTFGRGL